MKTAIRYCALLGVFASIVPSSIGSSPDPEYWRPPYAIRVTSKDERLTEGLITHGKWSGIAVTPNADPRTAFTIWPSYSPFEENQTPGFVGQVFEDQYHSTTNSSEFILIWRGRPGSSSGSPMLGLEIDKGPGILHVWPALTIAQWGGWQFVWNETENKFFFEDTHNTNGHSKWIAYFDYDTWELYRWNGSTPDKSQGWGWYIYDLIDNHVDVNVEAVPLWTLLDEGVHS